MLNCVFCNPFTTRLYMYLSLHMLLTALYGRPITRHSRHVTEGTGPVGGAHALELVAHVVLLAGAAIVAR